MSSGSSRIYNLISIVFLLLSVAACIVVLWLLLSAAPAEQGAAIEVPTIAAALLPTLTPSATATATDLPTFTPTATQTLVPSITPVPSETPIPPTTTFTPSPTLTITPSQTITNTPGPTPTDLPTETPTNTDVPTALPSPTGPTPSPYPFDVRGGAPSFTINFANSAGCSFQGIGGQVFDVNNQPLNGIRIHVLGQNFDNYTLSGSNTFYGAGGWEIALATTVSTTTYIVQLETEAGTIISPQVTVAFPGDCNRNLALVNFIQTRPY